MQKTLIFSAIAISSIALADGHMMKPGQWSTTVRMQMEGMPQNMPPMTHTRCVKPEDVKTPEQLAQSVGSQHGDCTVKSAKFSGSTLSWTAECHGRSNGTATGQMTFSGESYTGSMTIDMTAPNGQARKGKMEMSGTRTGDCT